MQIAGTLALVSSEVSAFIICLITLDRFQALSFPFSRHRLGVGSSQVACGGLWIIGLVLALFPLTPIVSHWRFYEQTSVCIPLPFTFSQSTNIDENFGHGQEVSNNVHSYSFGILIVLNFVIFVLVASGQLAIFATVRSTSLAVLDNRKARTSNDMKLARRLMSIVVSDFLCWFPVGLLGLLAWQGMAVPGEVNVAVVTFVVPLNSALNPFLYTLSIIVEKRREQRYQMLIHKLESHLKINKDKRCAASQNLQD